MTELHMTADDSHTLTIGYKTMHEH